MTERHFPGSTTRVFMIVVLLAVSFLAGRAATPVRNVNAQGAGIAVPAAPAGAQNCQIYNFAVYDNRLQVRCWETTPLHFAIGLSSAGDSRQANRFLAILNTAIALNRVVVVYHSDDPADNPPGCDPSDCRLLQGMVIAG